VGDVFREPLEVLESGVEGVRGYEGWSNEWRMMGRRRRMRDKVDWTATHTTMVSWYTISSYDNDPDN
jgi:hypothetical protein